MPTQAQRGGGGIALTHSQSGSRRRWVVSTTLRPLYSRKRPGIHCKGGWMDLGARQDATETLASIGIRCLYSPVRSESLYRLRDPGRHNNNNNYNNNNNNNNNSNNVLPVTDLKTKLTRWPSKSLQRRHSSQLNQSSTDKEANLPTAT
jgi:hypothetical protein